MKIIFSLIILAFASTIAVKAAPTDLDYSRWLSILPTFPPSKTQEELTHQESAEKLTDEAALQQFRLFFTRPTELPAQKEANKDDNAQLEQIRSLLRQFGRRRPLEREEVIAEQNGDDNSNVLSDAKNLQIQQTLFRRLFGDRFVDNTRISIRRWLDRTEPTGSPRDFPFPTGPPRDFPFPTGPPGDFPFPTESPGYFQFPTGPPGYFQFPTGPPYIENKASVSEDDISRIMAKIAYYYYYPSYSHFPYRRG